ncbi:hypothetical protein, partial [Mesorhizobium sp. M0778]|uniref:hypothetical protein n=1 Tax=Mesorhizobium sp. M0778 TaxID=2956999 RepID=UPI003334B80B
FMRDLLGKCVPSPRKTAAKKFCSKPMERNGKRSEWRNKLHLMTLPAYGDPAANSIISIHEVSIEDIPLLVSITRWANQPLHSQATTSVSVEVTLLLEPVLSHARPG